MNSGQNPVSRKNNIVVQDLENEILIYDLAKNKALCLNETSALIWQECDGTKSVAEITRKLSNKFKSHISEDFVWLALQQFKKDELLEKSVEFTTPLDGLNRREIVKRIGFASIIALPVVASVLAPTAVSAQSGACGCLGAPGTMQFNPGCACGGNLDCCINSCAQGTCEAEGTLQGPVCCPAAIICPPFNQVNPPGCGCNDNSNCISMNCVSNICRL